MQERIKSSPTGVIITELTNGAGVGAVVWWRLRGTLKHSALISGWEDSLLDPKLLPDAPSANSVLGRCMNDLAGKGSLIRPLDEKQGGGYAFLRGGKDGHGKPKFDTAWSCRIGKLDSLEFEGDVKDVVQDALEQEFERNLGILGANDVGSWLSTKIIPAVSATRLRDTGGIYYVPECGVSLWRETKGIVSDTSQTVLEEIPAMRTSNAVEAILRSLQEEVDEAIGALNTELEEWAKSHAKPFVIQRRHEAARQLRDKLEKYEASLGVKLPEMRAQQEAIQARITAALMAAGGAK